ncbi:MAG TPA: VOC family protein [Anaerolineae bacterium]|nr:VOC family protein [Anaerolineae bacterium]
MKIEGQHHIGITVSDLERSIEFYRDMLGMTLRSEGELTGERISKIVGLQGTHIKSAYLAAGDLVLELFQYLEPAGGKQKASLRQIDVGHYHLAFLVDDIDDAYEKLTARGVRFSDAPQHFENGGGAIYFWDPDGVALEFIQASK